MSLSIIKATNSNRVLTLLQRQQQRRRKNDSLVRILLEQSVYRVSLVVDDYTADATDGPCAVDAVGLTHWLVAETHVVDVWVTVSEGCREGGEEGLLWW